METVYKIRKPGLVPGTAYTAAVGAPDASGASIGFVGILDLNFGRADFYRDRAAKSSWNGIRQEPPR